jgi:hypothetical protein
LKRWIELELLKSKIFEQSKHGNTEELSISLCSYVSLCLDIDNLLQYPWWEIAEAFIKLVVLNRPTREYAILKETKHKQEIQLSWDFDGRTWYVWANNFAKAYHWTLFEIAKLDIDDAIALLQEIYADDQYEKEWVYSLSEVAYPYDESTKKSKYKPLPRPEWMKEVVILAPPKKIKILRSMMPVGAIQKIKGTPSLDDLTN